MLLNRRTLLHGLGAAALSKPLLSAALAYDGFIELRAREAEAQLLAEGEPKTKVWAYGDRVPGPILRARQGEPFKVRFHNQLSQPSTVHWHGIRIENAMDGVANLTQAPVPPGESFNYIFTPPDAGTYWYHPHSRTWEQLARGLYGMLIVEEENAPAFDLDLPLMLDDWRLTDDGAIDETTLGNMMDKSHAGRLGNWVTVNGTSYPKISVPAGGLVRFRLANASNARVLDLKPGRLNGQIIAIDGQPVKPMELGSDPVSIAPAQRIDFAVRIPETEGSSFPLELAMRDRGIEIAELKITEKADTSHYKVTLPPNPLPLDMDLTTALNVDLRMEGGAMGSLQQASYKGELLTIRELVRKGNAWAFNGVSGRPDKPLFTVKRGRTVIVNMMNETAWPHAMHFHGHHVKVIERNGKPVADAPWRDTELMQRNDQIQVAFPADNPGKWMLHCHMLEHQVAGMATWFEVI